MLKDNKEYKRFVWEFSNIINKNKAHKNIIFLCIGTNKIIGDSIGPIVGTSLKTLLQTNSKLKQNLEINNKNIKVIGDVFSNISYQNIDENMQNIKNSVEDNYVIVIDSALSSENNIGKIFVQNRGLKYAESLKRKNTIIGDMSIKAVVGKNMQNRFKNFKILKNISSKRIVAMSNILSNGIIDAMSLIE